MSLKPVLISLSIITGFIFVITVSSIYVSDMITNGDACRCVIPVPLMILLLSSLGVFVGGVTSFVFIDKLREKEQEMGRMSLNSREMLLRILEEDEAKVVRRLLKEKGKAAQAQITKELGNDRVKAHRILKKLEEKKVILIDRAGKSNSVRLRKDLFRAVGEPGE